MSDIRAQNRAVLDAVRVRRDRLYEAILGLEKALATPAGDHPKEWATLLAAPIESLRAVLDSHIEGTEGDDGLFAQIREDAPHLLNAVERLRNDHQPLVASVTALAEALPGVHDDDTVDAVRTQALQLMRELLHHRHLGAEVVYDAYAVDVSAAD
jgi:hypothetical protein